MKCISIRQPWAWLIIHAGKDIENRTWKTDLRGRVSIHASKGMTEREYQEALLFVGRFDRDLMFRIPKKQRLEFGGIIGEVDLVDCVDDLFAPRSPWFVGPWGHVYKNPVAVPFWPYTGSLGYFEI